MYGLIKIWFGGFGKFGRILSKRFGIVLKGMVYVYTYLVKFAKVWSC